MDGAKAAPNEKEKGMSDSVRRRRTAVFLTLSLTFVSVLSARSKIDVVLLRNGDRVTGEIKMLDRGLLVLSTDYMSEVKIEWPDVARIISSQVFEVEGSDGRTHLGSLPDTGQPDEVSLLLPTGEIRLDRAEVVRIRPLEERIWDRFATRLDFGFNLLQANSQTEYTLGNSTDYRAERWEVDLDYNSSLSDRTDTDRVTRNSLSLVGRRMLDNRWFVGGVYQFDENSQQNLEARSLFGSVFGRALIHSNRTILQLIGGVAVTRESFAGQELDENSTSTNLEAISGVNFSFVQFRAPETDISTALLFFPNLSDAGSYRLEFQTTISWEIFKNFDFGVTLFDSFNSGVTGDAARNDYGLYTAIGWKLR